MIYHFKNPHGNKEHNKGWVRWSIRSEERPAVHLLLMQGLTGPWSCCPIGRSFVLKLWNYTQMHTHTHNTTPSQHTHIRMHITLVCLHRPHICIWGGTHFIQSYTQAMDSYQMCHTWAYLQLIKCQAKCPSNLSNFVLTCSFGERVLYAE